MIELSGISRHSQSHRETSSFAFTLTEKDSAKIRHGICLNFFQSFEKCYPLSANGKGGRTNSNRSRKRWSLFFCSMILLIIKFFFAHHQFLILLSVMSDHINNQETAISQYSTEFYFFLHSAVDILKSMRRALNKLSRECY